MLVSFVGEFTTIQRLRQDLTEQGLLEDIQEAIGTPAEVERLGFDLSDILTIIGAISSVVEACKLAKLLVKAVYGSKTKRIEIVGPTGRVLIDLSNKTDEEIAMAVKQALPFLR